MKLAKVLHFRVGNFAGIKVKLKNMKPKLSQLAKEVLAEFMATFILIMFGVGSVAQAVLSKQQNGTFFSINFGWGIGVTMGCYWAGGISGAHMNPAVTLANAVVGRIPWRKLPGYFAGQMLGAFVASAVVYGIYYDALNAFDGGVRQILGPKGTAGIWATYPQPFLSIGSGFADQLVGTALLVSCVFAIVDKHNNAPDRGSAPILIGLVVFVIGATFGFNCGYAINPARDLAPRIFTAIAGWGSEVFTVSDNWSWVPVIGCLVGGVVGALLYICTIEMHHSTETEDTDADLQLNRVVVESINPAYDNGSTEHLDNPKQQQSNGISSHQEATPEQVSVTITKITEITTEQTQPNNGSPACEESKM